MPYALEYGRVIALGFPFVIIGVIVNGVVRADGSPKYSMFSMMLGSILNVFLDPLFIFVFHMGIGGAALATIISQFISMVLNVAYLFKFKNIKLTRESFRFQFSLAGMLASLGIARCLNTMTSTIIAIVSNNMLTHYGALSIYGEDIPITVFGLCMKVSMLFFSVAMGISSANNILLWSLVMGKKSGVISEENPSDAIYFAQAKAIRELAEKESCVIVGRCSDYILRDRADCLHVFICADKHSRAKRILERYGDNSKPIEKRIDDKDTRRRLYYAHYTDRIWGAPENYHVTLNSGALGEEACIQAILNLV